MVERGAIMVLGASRGLGRAIALKLASEGFVVGVACRNLTDAQAVTAEIVADGGTAIAVAADVTCARTVEDAFEKLDACGLALVGVINNAGAIDPIGHVGDAAPEQWARTIEINLVGAFHGAQAALRRLKKGGVIVNLSSKAAEVPMEGWSAYCASKAGLAMLTRSIAEEYREAGVRVFGLRPGLVDTDMQSAIRASGMNPISQLPQSDLTPPEKPAGLISWLCIASPEDLSGRELDIRDAALMERADHDPVSIAAACKQ